MVETPVQTIEREVKKAVKQGLPEYDLPQLYSLLGSYLLLLDTERKFSRSKKLKAKYRGKYREQGLLSLVTYENPEKVGQKFLEKYGKRILRAVCRRWKEIESQGLDTIGLASSLASEVFSALPPRYRIFLKLTVVIVFILVKRGLRDLCK